MKDLTATKAYSSSWEEMAGRNRRQTQTDLAPRIPSHKTQVFASTGRQWSYLCVQPLARRDVDCLASQRIAMPKASVQPTFPAAAAVAPSR